MNRFKKILTMKQKDMTNHCRKNEKCGKQKSNQYITGIPEEKNKANRIK